MRAPASTRAALLRARADAGYERAAAVGVLFPRPMLAGRRSWLGLRFIFLALAIALLAYLIVRYARGLGALVGEVRGRRDEGGYTGPVFILPAFAVIAAFLASPAWPVVLATVTFIAVMLWVSTRFFRLKDAL